METPTASAAGAVMALARSTRLHEVAAKLGQREQPVAVDVGGAEEQHVAAQLPLREPAHLSHTPNAAIDPCWCRARVHRREGARARAARRARVRVAPPPTASTISRLEAACSRTSSVYSLSRSPACCCSSCVHRRCTTTRLGAAPAGGAPPPPPPCCCCRCRSCPRIATAAASSMAALALTSDAAARTSALAASRRAAARLRRLSTRSSRSAASSTCASSCLCRGSAASSCGSASSPSFSSASCRMYRVSRVFPIARSLSTCGTHDAGA